VFSATPDPGVCGTFTNHAASFVPDLVRATSAALAAVDVPCPPDPPPDPLILLTKDASASSVVVPGTITYVITFENAGPGVATNVTATDELPAGAEWTLGSGSNVCTIDGKTLTCFAETVPDGVFEVLEIFGAVDGSVCGTMDNQSTVDFEGGPDAGSVTAVAPPVDVTGCTAPTPEPAPTEGDGDEGAGGAGDGDLPDTAADPPPTLPIGLLTAIVVSASVVLLRTRRT
jgi:uncharacterized repeat protein (TIGR01451 family)